MDDKTIFYIVGGLLALAAVAISFLGIRDKDFPSSGRASKIVLAAFAVGVVLAGAYAILAAREEQAERREHLAEAEAHAAEGEESGEEAAAGEQASDEEGSPPGEAPEGETEEGGTGAEEGGDELVTQGAEVFTAQGCGSCHALAAADATGAVGPDLDVTLQEQSAAAIEESIVDPNAKVVDGFEEGVMPTTYGEELTPEDIEALVEFLEFAVSQS